MFSNVIRHSVCGLIVPNLRHLVTSFLGNLGKRFRNTRHSNIWDTIVKLFFEHTV
jgi:peptidyl-tRNA hydrolase